MMAAVGDDINTMRIDEYWDILDFLNGFKDGAVRVTGEESKLYYCNGNLSDSINVFYNNYAPYFSDPTTNFNDENRRDSLTNIMYYVNTTI
jgi:hypothetical protein